MRHFYKLNAIYTSSVLVRLLCCSSSLFVPQAVVAGITIERVTQSTTTNAQLELEAWHAKGMQRQTPCMEHAINQFWLAGWARMACKS